MKKSKKILLIAAVALILTGCITMGAAWASLSKMSAEEIAFMQYEEQTHTITEPFNDIIISTINSSIQILPSSDGSCRIVCDDNEKMFHQVSFQESEDGTVLHIAQRNEWKWYETLGGLHWEEPPVLIVYLPQAEYEILDAVSGSGDITVAPDFRFGTLHLNSTSGNTALTGIEAEHLNVLSASGDILLRSVRVSEDAYLQNVSGFTRVENLTASELTSYASSGETVLENASAEYLNTSTVSGFIRVYDGNFSNTSYFETSSGDIEIVDSECGEQRIKTVSGKLSLQNITGISLTTETSSGSIGIFEAFYSHSALCNTVSGEIQFSGLDAENLEFITSSGDISGNLRSPKNFITETSSGYMDVPPSDESAGTCSIRTVSGNVSIVIDP